MQEGWRPAGPRREAGDPTGAEARALGRTELRDPQTLAASDAVREAPQEGTKVRGHGLRSGSGRTRQGPPTRDGAARLRGSRPRLASGVALLITLGLGACALSGESSEAADPMRYRLSGSGSHWDVVGRDRVLDDLLPRYPEFFGIVLDPTRNDEADLGRLRDDLEKTPVTRENYDALNAIAVAYFEMNYRAESLRDTGRMEFLSAGMRSAKLAAVPWRAYGEIEDPRLRDAVLDFFEDVVSSEKLGAAATAGRLTRVVRSLARKESDPERLRRIEEIARRMREADARARANARAGTGAGGEASREGEAPEAPLP